MHFITSHDQHMSLTVNYACHMSNKSAISSSPLLSSGLFLSLTHSEWVVYGQWWVWVTKNVHFIMFSLPTRAQEQDSPQMSLNSLFDCPQYNYPVYLYTTCSQASVLLFFIHTFYFLLHLFLIVIFLLPLLQTTPSIICTSICNGFLRYYAF